MKHISPNQPKQKMKPAAIARRVVRTAAICALGTAVLGTIFALISGVTLTEIIGDNLVAVIAPIVVCIIAIIFLRDKKEQKD